jgi:hypothetical protein
MVSHALAIYISLFQQSPFSSHFDSTFLFPLLVMGHRWQWSQMDLAFDGHKLLKKSQNIKKFGEKNSIKTKKHI